MRVLFVDDEPRVLEGIQRMMFGASPNAHAWQVATAAGGADAIAAFEREAFDVVVSDMRMPAMDGAELLGVVMDRWPGALRVILSGQTDEEASKRALRVAHRFLAKPCATEILLEVVERTQRLNSALKDARLRAAIARLGRLPSPPAIYAELVSMLNQDRAGVRDVTAIVRKDPALSAKILQIANSAFFARATAPIADLHAAVVRLGLRMIASLALREGVFQSGARYAEPSELKALQERSLRTAEVAHALAPAGCARDEAFTAGLLCDVGRLVVAGGGRSVWTGLASANAEHRSLGTTHSEVGAYLLDLWGLPFRIVEAVAYHHSPEHVPRRDACVAAVAQTANALVHGEEPWPSLLEIYSLDLAAGRRALKAASASAERR